MSKFTPDERKGLYALFTVDEHEIREGATSKDKSKISWFIYIRREAIINRLDDLFFGEWSSGFLNPENPYQYHDKHVDCAMHLTIRDMRREYNGSQDGGGLNGAKGAATDAFKRVASQWGIGLYLQQSPMIWTENYKDSSGRTDYKKKDAIEADVMRRIEKWLRGLGASGNSVTTSSDDSSQPDSYDGAMAEHQRQQEQVSPVVIWTETDIKKFWNKWRIEEGYTEGAILNALNVDGLKEFKESLQDADKCMKAYLDSHPDTPKPTTQASNQ